MRIAIIVIACFVIAALIGLLIQHIVRRHKAIKLTELETGEIKPLRQRAKEWLITHKPSKRRLIQVYAALLYNANIKGFITGNIYQSETTKYMCVPGLNCYSCPGAVGACPLGAFQNALAESNTRAPYYVLGIIGLFGLMLARTVCGFLCPVGLGQELLYKIRTPKLKKNRVTRVLSYFKYVLLIVLAVALPLMYAFRDIPLPAFCKYICPAGTLGGAIGLLINPANADKFGMLGGQFTWKFSLLVVFIVGSVFIFRFFCRFFCPLGALYGFFNKISLIGVKLERNDCIDCGKCIAVCKMDTKRVGDHECINCGECIAVCPTKAISWKGSKIFLHKSAIDTTPTIKALDTAGGVVTVNPIQQGVAAQVSDSQSVVVQSAETHDTAPEKAEATKDAAKATEGAQAASKRKKRDKKFWLQLAAVITAAIVLIGALVYYNFIDVKPQRPRPSDENVGYEIGQTAPDFTVDLYNEDGSFTLYDNLGKVTVINFWATWCTPCVNELPYFDMLAKNHDDINVIAIHGSSTRDVTKFIADNFPDFVITFAQDNLDGNICLTFDMFGGTSMWPLTVILDEEGKVLYNSTNSFHSYHDLENTFNGLFEEEEQQQ
ncbi:MAG: redoxin domain-containing protein [Clostridia bacterium]|nr:redoxin domain-containing protein [Clostridia bacterium]